MKNPPHPGLSVRPDCLEPLGLSVTKAAELLGVTRQALDNLINGKRGISPEMAIRLSKMCGSSAETWRGMQLAYDLAQAKAWPEPAALLGACNQAGNARRQKARE